MVNSWAQAEEAWDDFLDEEGPVTVLSMEFLPSRVLFLCDPIAYRCGLLDFLDSMGIDTDGLD